MRLKTATLKSLLMVFCVGVLVAPEITQAKAVIDSLDFAVTGSWELDCEILGSVDLERDPNWTNEEYYVRLVEEYMVQGDPDFYPTVEAYRDYVKDLIPDVWDSIAKGVYLRYAEYRHEDFSDREEYYSEYHDELEDEYYQIFILYALGFQPEDFRSELFQPQENLSVKAYDVIANYCDSSHPPIGTTYGWGDIGKMLLYGYRGYLRLGEDEISLENEPLLAVGNGYYYHKDDFADFSVKLKHTDATTVVATYNLKNLKDENTEFGVAFYGDTTFEMENNADFYALTTKTDNSFTIVQDNPIHSDSFGARLSIELSPNPSTTYVGSYADAKADRWRNSVKDKYTAVDHIDTGIAYSWQGEIAVGETKEFSATYHMDVAESFENNFYFLNDGYAEPKSRIEAIDGGALELPFVSLSDRIGHHHEWNTKSDGSGNFYNNAKTIIAHEDQPNYYEVLVPNRVESEIKKSEGPLREQTVVITDEMRERYKNLAESSLSNVFLGVDLYMYDEDTAESYISEGPIGPREISKNAGENFQLEGLFMFSELFKTYVDNTGTPAREPLMEDELPVTIRIKFPEEYVEGKSNFNVVEITCDDMMESCNNYSPVTSVYNGATGELFFEVENSDYADMIYALSYAVETPEEPVVEPETPDVPKTGTNNANVADITNSETIEMSILSLTAIIVILCFGCLKFRRRC